MLRFDATWRFDTPGVKDSDLTHKVVDNVIFRIATERSRTDVTEVFKKAYCQSAREQYYPSSSESWAYSDLISVMQRLAEENVALFCEALYDGIIAFQKIDTASHIPPWNHINKYLLDTGFSINPPELVLTSGSGHVKPPPKIPSLSEQANEVINKSLDESEQFFAAGKYRAAVQSVLWLLESVSTSFRGVEYAKGGVTGKYFIKIIGDLRRFNKGTTLDRVAMWLENVYGFLSAPDGGGVRHGSVLADYQEINAAEARLYCDLIRSFINYLLHEHARVIK